MELATAFPGNTGIRPQSVAPLAEMLRLNGYSTAAFGKYHETPPWEVSVSGPYDRWPTHSGFDKFYGFIGGETNQWAPAIFDGTIRVEHAQTPDYHFTVDMTDQALAWMQAQHSLTPDSRSSSTSRPARCTRRTTRRERTPTATRGSSIRAGTRSGGDPRAAEEAGGRAAVGRADEAPQGDPLVGFADAGQRKVMARQMEVYAGFGEHTDEQVGRLVAALQEMGVMDNTLFLYIVGDNGASAEGGPEGAYNEMMALNGIVQHRPDQHAPHRELGRPEHVSPLRDRLGLGGRHAVPMDEAGRVALRRHDERRRRPLAEEDQ
jgi:arylsulfatase